MENPSRRDVYKRSVRLDELKKIARRRSRGIVHVLIYVLVYLCVCVCVKNGFAGKGVNLTV